MVEEGDGRGTRPLSTPTLLKDRIGHSELKRIGGSRVSKKGN